MRFLCRVIRKTSENAPAKLEKVSLYKENIITYSFLSFAKTTITNKEFLGSMIPHYSGAILMCREANITDPEIKTLCQTIMEVRQQEIDQMQAILNREN